MTDYDIRLDITYTYTTPAKTSRSLLRLLPRTTPEQTLLSGLVTADPPPAHQSNAVDFFGNATTETVYDRPLDHISFRFGGRVRRHAQPPLLDLSTELGRLETETAGIVSLAPDAPHHFLPVSPRAAHDPAITDFVRAVLHPEMSVIDGVLAAAHALHGEMRFDPTATDVTTEPGAAFAARSGVCQDFSHILIAGLRALGVPAGYVSGFLRTEPPPGQPRLEGADAMHAWVRAWCGQEAGWIEVDPTNNVRVGDDHVVVAYGRDYGDVAPVRGTLRAAGPHTTDHSVDVVPLAPVR